MNDQDKNKRRFSRKSDRRKSDVAVSFGMSASEVMSESSVQNMPSSQPDNQNYATNNADIKPTITTSFPMPSTTDTTANTSVGQTSDVLKYSGGVIGHNDLQRARDITDRIEKIFTQRIVGQEQMRIALLTALIANGHILIESVPGLAKTTAAETLCSAIQGKFSRIQCTPDLMPNDIVGTQVYNYSNGQFTTQLGPVHANLVLLDEINRSSAKTQSAMLEAMQERQTTIGDKSYKLPTPFMVIATQNPIEEEGTYVLPEAQMDRFLLKEVIIYPTPEEEVEMLNNIIACNYDKPLEGFVVTLEDINSLQQLAKQVHIAPAIIHYIISIVNTTRGRGPNPIVGLNRLVRVGASPRASIAFIRCCQALALLSGRPYVIPEDVRDMAYPVLRHRILRTFDAMAEDVFVESIIDQIFQVVPIP